MYCHLSGVFTPTDRDIRQEPRSRSDGRELKSKEQFKPQDRNPLVNELGRDSKTTLVIAVSLVLIWSLIGMSSDPMAPAPEWMQDMASSM